MIPSIPMKFAAAILGVLLALSTARGQTTTPSPTDDPPAPAAMAPSYVSIGKGLRLRLALIRRTLADLTLDAAIKQRADQIVDSADAEIKDLLAAIQSGRMPGYHRLMAVPDNLRTARANQLAVIGPDQSDLLQEKLRSLRGEARNEVNWLRQQLSDLNLSDGAARPCNQILSETEMAVEKLPDMDVQGDQYARARAAMNQLFVKAHDGLAKILSAAEQLRLGPHFAELASQPPAVTTQPAPGS
jgi:hypothetical protein